VQQRQLVTLFACRFFSTSQSETRGLLIFDPEHPQLDFEPGSSLDHLQAASIAYRIARPPRRAQGPDPIQRATVG